MKTDNKKSFEKFQVLQNLKRDLENHRKPWILILSISLFVLVLLVIM